MSSVAFRVILTWLLFIPLAVFNGIVRELLFRDAVGELVAHQISTVIAIAGFMALAFFLLRKHITSLKTMRLLVVGGLWVVVTMVFEFGFGHYVENISWNLLFRNYNLFQGRVWGLLLLMIFLTPLIIKRIEKHQVIKPTGDSLRASSIFCFIVALTMWTFYSLPFSVAIGERTASVFNTEQKKIEVKMFTGEHEGIPDKIRESIRNTGPIRHILNLPLPLVTYDVTYHDTGSYIELVHENGTKQRHEIHQKCYVDGREFTLLSGQSYTVDSVDITWFTENAKGTSLCSGELSQLSFRGPGSVQGNFGVTLDFSPTLFSLFSLLVAYSALLMAIARTANVFWSFLLGTR